MKNEGSMSDLFCHPSGDGEVPVREAESSDGVSGERQRYQSGHAEVSRKKSFHTIIIDNNYDNAIYIAPYL